MDKVAELTKRTIETDETLKPPSQPKPKKIKVESEPAEDVEGELGEGNIKKLENFVALPATDISASLL